jgi:hypothetical protein
VVKVGQRKIHHRDTETQRKHNKKPMTTESPAIQRDFVELKTDVSHSPLWNKDLAPTTITERTWSTWNIAAL